MCGKNDSGRQSHQLANLTSRGEFEIIETAQCLPMPRFDRSLQSFPFEEKSGASAEWNCIR